MPDGMELALAIASKLASYEQKRSQIKSVKVARVIPNAHRAIASKLASYDWPIPVWCLA
jgi:hypothetical protein